MKTPKTLLLALACIGITSAAPAQADDANYSLEVTGSAVVGKEGTVTIKIVPKGGYHFNQEFPTTVKDANGATIVSQSLQKSEAQGVVTVKINASKANPTAKLKSAVCREGACAPFTAVVTLPVK